MKISLRVCGIALLAVGTDVTRALKVDIDDKDSIKSAASKVASGLVKYYTGNVTNTPETIGVLEKPYYWWEAGALWGALVDYYRLTGDSSYNDITYNALISQVGADYNYMPELYATSEGNDDQSMWGFATMSAAEFNWRAPASPTPSWLQLTINLWNSQAARWDAASCAGGLRWQIYSFLNGYDYKDTRSNGGFFQLSARLARYTGNATYLTWAEKSWDWTRSIGFIDDEYDVFDGSTTTSNCSTINRVQLSYNAGVYLYGAAAMYNATGSVEWQQRTTGLLKRVSGVFFGPFDNSTDVMWESSCEALGSCNTDMLAHKAILSRFMWATAKLAPFTAPTISKLLSTSAAAAAKACDGGATGEECGAKWYTGHNDGSFGVGQQMAALEVLQGLLSPEAKPPLTAGEVKPGSPGEGAGVAGGGGSGGSTNEGNSGDGGPSAVSTSPSPTPTNGAGGLTLTWRNTLGLACAAGAVGVAVLFV